MSTVTHCAGPPVTIGGRVIQRCAVCGEKLCDSLGAAMPLPEEGIDPVFPTWKQAGLVQIEPGTPTRSSLVGDLLSTKPLPDDFCLQLVER